MKIAILSLYTDAHAPLNAITAPLKQSYADRWGYTFINHIGTLDETRPPSWSKIPLIQRHLTDFDWVYWIDADAMIMNPAIALETYLRDYDLIISQERSKSHFGTFQLNAGAFFARNRPWTHRFLETVYGLEQFREHIYWDQAAMWHVLEQDPDACDHVYVETEPKRFNAFSNTYSKGDFVFHAVSFSTDVSLKETLLRETLEGDRKIPQEHQPKVKVQFLMDRSDASSRLLGEFAMPSLVETNLGGTELYVDFVDAALDALFLLKRHAAFSSLLGRIAAINRTLRKHEGEHLVFTGPDIQFLQDNWRRFCLVQLGEGDGCFLENGARRGRLGDAFFIVRATANVIAFFSAAADRMDRERRSGEAPRIHSFADLTEIVKPAEYGCDFRLFSGNHIKNAGKCPEGLEVFNLVVHSAECIPDADGKRQALEATRNAFMHILQAIMDVRLKD